MFGVYDILETVGQGGMGVVYRAQDTALDRIVALKVLKEDLRQNKQVAARFQREAEAIASLNHPNITHIYTVGAVGRIPYIAMEFIEGATLSVAMKRVKTFPWKRALHIAEQVAEALACAHESHIIHRDIKPGNILLGAKDHAYVTDFGIAKVLTAETQLTVEGSRLGTPHYMSPERCSKADISPSSDLYSLGVVLFQMLSGRLPYEANSPVELIRKIVAQPPARLSEFVPEIPEDVERLVAYLLEKKPPNRPKSAAEVAEMCRRVIEGEPLFGENSVATSLRDFRDNNPTPSTTTNTHIDSALGEARGAWARMIAAWGRVPASARLWSAGFCIIAAMAGAGQWTARRWSGNFALGTVAHWDRSTAGWTEDTAPAEIAPESVGVTLARCNFPGFAVARIAPTGASGFVVELRDTTNRHANILALHPESDSVRVGLPANAFGDSGAGTRLVAGTLAANAGRRDEVIEPYYFVAETRGGPTLQRADALLSSGDYGHLVVHAEDLRGVVGGTVTEMRSVAISANSAEAALSARTNTSTKDQVVRVRFGESGAVKVDPLLMDTFEVVAMAYNAYGDLFVAQQTGTRLTVRRIEAGARDPNKSLVAEFSTVDSTLLSLSGSGVLMSERPKDATPRITWRDFATGDDWDLGEALNAAVAADGTFSVVAAPDRRGNDQIWLVARKTSGERRQLTFLASGVGPGLALSWDGRYAIASARGLSLPTLVMVDIEAASGA